MLKSYGSMPDSSADGTFKPQRLLLSRSLITQLPVRTLHNAYLETPLIKKLTKSKV